MEDITYIMGTEGDIQLCKQIKIGRSKDPEYRRTQGATFAPGLRIYYTANNGDLEKYAKENFGNYRLSDGASTEWYHFVDEHGEVRDDLYTWIVERFQVYDDSGVKSDVKCEHDGGWKHLIEECQEAWEFPLTALEAWLGSGQTTVSYWLRQKQPFIQSSEHRAKLNELYMIYCSGDPCPFPFDIRRKPKVKEAKVGQFEFIINTDLNTLNEILTEYGDRVSCPTLAPVS